ncbi:MAG: rhodanese-like domain-containing protein [Myxococcota bacterium]|jgi:rhodanese-related sulfurtransferase|nr:rhodanese-like domain-containing protein [Myxococcota bacterium]
MAPFDVHVLGGFAQFLIFFAIGLGFGVVLELSGFGDSRKLAAQFYLHEMTVLKVMFTGIVVASLLIFLACSLELLDFDRVFVNPTYLWPGIVGGLIGGVGFIIGGFCPGTSLVAASTLKIDGMVFLVGVGLGTLLFGETVGNFEDFYHSSHLGRFTLMDLFGVDAGVVLLGLVGMAVGAFALAELAERRFGVVRGPVPRLVRIGGGALFGVALLVAVLGQPDLADRWQWIAAATEQRLADRSVFIHPAELTDLRKQGGVSTIVLDVRSEREYNVFHLYGALRVDPDRPLAPALLQKLKAQEASTAVLLIGRGEAAAVGLFKTLSAAGVGNLYIIEGGYANWLAKYPPSTCLAEKDSGNEEFGYRFRRAVGQRAYAAHPDCACKEVLPYFCGMPGVDPVNAPPVWPTHTYPRKVTIQARAKVVGGCG